MNKAFKFRIYPNKEQEILINKTFCCSRKIFNHFLDLKDTTYKTTGKSLNYTLCSKELTVLKNIETYLKEVDKFALQNSLRDLETAYKNFFQKRSGFPKFKAKYYYFQSYRTNFTNDNIKVFEKSIQLPKLGLIKRKGYKNLPDGKILSATVSKNNLNQYYCSLLLDIEILKKPVLTTIVGIDLGIKYFAVLSNGDIIPNHKTLNKYEDMLIKEQKRLSSKVKGSKNYHKQRMKLAKIHNKIKNIRHDFLSKVTTKLINENQVICLEDLNVKGMLKNHHLAKAISNLGINDFERQLNYKADWYGRDIIYVDRFYQSSQLCSKCGTLNPLVKDLNIREWECPHCKEKHDIDFNASKNIEKEGLRLYKIRSLVQASVGLGYPHYNEVLV